MDDPTEWLLTKSERANPQTTLDDRHDGDRAWSEGNLVRPLIHGATYFRALYDALEATGPGDMVLFTDWQGDADQLLTGESGSEVVETLARADRRGVAVHGLVWRSHLDQTGFFATENRHLVDPHDEYMPHEGFGPVWQVGARQVRRRGGVADQHVGKLLSSWRSSRGRRDNGDHRVERPRGGFRRAQAVAARVRAVRVAGAGAAMVQAPGITPRHIEAARSRDQVLVRRPSWS